MGSLRYSINVTLDAAAITDRRRRRMRSRCSTGPRRWSAPTPCSSAGDLRDDGIRVALSPATGCGRRDERVGDPLRRGHPRGEEVRRVEHAERGRLERGACSRRPRACGSTSHPRVRGTVWVGGVTLPVALADLGLIDEYEFVVQPVLAGHGPALLSGLRERIPLRTHRPPGVPFRLVRPAISTRAGAGAVTARAPRVGVRPCPAVAGHGRSLRRGGSRR